MNHFVRGIFKDVIQPSVVEALSEYKLKGFKFERLVLGRIVSYNIFIERILFGKYNKYLLI